MLGNIEIRKKELYKVGSNTNFTVKYCDEDNLIEEDIYKELLNYMKNYILFERKGVKCFDMKAIDKEGNIIVVGEYNSYVEDNVLKGFLTKRRITKETNEFYFVEEEQEVYNFNLTTNELVYTEDIIEVFLEADTSNNDVNYELLFLQDIIYIYKNLVSEDLYTKLLEVLKAKRHHNSFEDKNPTIYLIAANETLVTNMVNLVFKRIDDLEKLLKSQVGFLEKNLTTTVIELNEGNKVKQLLGLPKKALDTLSVYDLEEHTLRLSNLELDGNDYTLLGNFIDRVAELDNKEHRNRSSLTIFLDNLITILESNKDYRMKALLNNLLNNVLEHSLKLDGGLLDNLSDKVTELKDYIKMAKDKDIEHIKYPSNITREHNVLVKNLKVSIKQEELEEAIKRYGYEDLIKNFESEKYVLMYPKTVKELINEGLKLHHCVASYDTNIVNGTSKILFLRNKEEVEEPFVTIELDSDNKLRHIKGKYNEDPSFEIQSELYVWSLSN